MRRTSHRRYQVANIAATAAATTAVDSHPIAESGRGSTNRPMTRFCRAITMITAISGTATRPFGVRGAGDQVGPEKRHHAGPSAADLRLGQSSMACGNIRVNSSCMLGPWNHCGNGGKRPTARIIASTRWSMSE